MTAIWPILTMAEVEKDHLLTVLQRCGGNKSKAARVLGISRCTIINRLKKYEREQRLANSSE